MIIIGFYPRYLFSVSIYHDICSQLTGESEQKVQKARDLLEDIVDKNKGKYTCPR